VRVAAVFVVAVAAAIVVTGCATQTATSGRIAIKDDRRTIDIHFSDHDRSVIYSYYSQSLGRGLPPGLAKRQQLPPGLAKRDTLPPGLQGEPLPSDLERQLAPLPSGYVRIRVGRDIVLYNAHTRVVFDIVFNVSG